MVTTQSENLKLRRKLLFDEYEVKNHFLKILFYLKKLKLERLLILHIIYTLQAMFKNMVLMISHDLNKRKITKREDIFNSQTEL